MRKLRKVFALLLCTLIFTSILSAFTGCSDGRTQIKIAYWINNANERTNNQYIFTAFEKAFPQYRVTPVAVSYDAYGDEIPRLYAGNTLPDLLWIREEYLPIFANKGIIDPIDSYLENDAEFDRTRYFENALEFSTYKEKIYGLPRDIGCQVMAFNLDIMGDTPLPNSDWTWDDMVTLAESKTVKSGDTITQYGFGWTDWLALVHSNGGRLFSNDGQTALLNDEKVVKALQFYSDLPNVLKIYPTAEASMGIGNPFTGKKAAFAVVGPWDFAKLKKAKINFDIRPFPKGPDGEGRLRLSGLTIGINSKSTKKEAAYQLLKYLSYSDEAQTLQAQYSIAMPSIKSIAQSDIYSKSQFAPPSMDIYFDALASTDIISHFEGEIPALGVLDDYIYQIFHKIDGQIKKVEDIKNEMNASVQEVLDEYKK